MNRSVCLAVILVIAAGCMPKQPAPTPRPPTPSPIPTFTAVPTLESPTASPQPAPTYTPAVEKGEHAYTSAASGFQYWLFIPQSYGDDPQKRWPLILFLHGANSLGTDLNLLMLEALPQILTFTPDFPFLVVSPQLADKNGSWTSEPTIDALFTLLGEVQALYSVDPQRVYLTGVSLGGGGTWGIGLRYPDRFAALVPVMGFYNIPFELPPNLCDLKETPIWAFHGDQDPIVPLELETGLVEALKECGGNVRITIYPGEKHDISGRVYNNHPELYTWMLEQKRK